MIELGLGLGLAEKFIADFQLAAGSDAHPGDNLLLETSDNLLYENGTDAMLLE